MASPIKRVLHIGASGRIGSHVLKALIANDFDVTVAIRAESQAVFSEHVQVVRLDVASPQALIDAFTGHDAVVSTVGVRAITEQYKFIDAAVAAGVRRFIPSDFGCDCENERVAASPAYKDRVEVARYFQRLVKDSSITLTYTSIATSILIEAVLLGPLPLVDFQNRQATLFDGGDVPVSMTPASMVGEAVAAVLRHPTRTANRSILMHGGAFTPRQVLSIVQQHVGADGWRVEEADTAQMEAESYNALSHTPGDIFSWLPGLVRRCLFGKEFGSDFTGRTANEALGLKLLSSSDLEQCVGQIIRGNDRESWVA